MNTCACEMHLNKTMRPKSVLEWTVQDVLSWLKDCGHTRHSIIHLFEHHMIDGKALLILKEDDLKTMDIGAIGDIKRLYISIRQLQRENLPLLLELGHFEFFNSQHFITHKQDTFVSSGTNDGSIDHEFFTASLSEDGTASHLPPEIWKTFLSLGYLFIVTWITAFVMVIVHDRVPDMKKYPPLPDIFLDNVPHIPWAFDMCEVTGTLLFALWLVVLIFHKYRFILLRRFFALSGTVFLLRCVTMLITSLSVPGAHLQCQPRAKPDEDYWSRAAYKELYNKIEMAYVIWRGAGMSIQGVRTCGDYMFSGHTVALTMLNFFITEYTPRHMYFVHTFTWMLNMFGIFFILAAHEHYSIDVFVAFYITSRLFLYYHTLANNQALMQRDSNRTRIWFPLFSFFESSVDGIVPNEYETPSQIVCNIIITAKDFTMLCRNYCLLSPRRRHQENVNGNISTKKNS